MGVLDLDDTLKVGVGRVFCQFPCDPGAVVRFPEKALERRHNAVGAGVLAEDGFSVLDDLFVGLSMIDNYKI